MGFCVVHIWMDMYHIHYVGVFLADAEKYEKKKLEQTSRREVENNDNDNK